MIVIQNSTRLPHASHGAWVPCPRYQPLRQRGRQRRQRRRLLSRPGSSLRGRPGGRAQPAYPCPLLKSRALEGAYFFAIGLKEKGGWNFWFAICFVVAIGLREKGGWSFRFAICFVVAIGLLLLGFERKVVGVFGLLFVLLLLLGFERKVGVFGLLFFVSIGLKEKGSWCSDVVRASQGSHREDAVWLLGRKLGHGKIYSKLIVVRIRMQPRQDGGSWGGFTGRSV